MDEFQADAVQAEIDRELGLVDSAIAMVCGGAALRVMVANLRLGAAVLEAARARGRLHDVRVTALWGPGDATCSLVVDRTGADG